MEQTDDTGYFVPFRKDHILTIKGNEFTDMAQYEAAFDCPNFKKYTIEENGEAFIIFCFRKYWEDNYEAFIIVSEDAAARHFYKMKKSIFKILDSMGVKRVHTISQSCDKIDRWHRFIGMECEGLLKQFIYGKDYKIWSWFSGN